MAKQRTPQFKLIRLLAMLLRLLIICTVSVAISGCGTQWTPEYYQQQSLNQALQHPYHFQQKLPTLSQPASFYLCSDQTSLAPCLVKTPLVNSKPSNSNSKTTKRRN